MCLILSYQRLLLLPLVNCLCIQHSSLLLLFCCCEGFRFMLAALHIESFYIPKNNYGPTSCFFFTLNTRIYTRLLFAQMRRQKRLKKQYIYLTCIYLLLDRTMIAYLFHTLFMNSIRWRFSIWYI